MKPSTKELCGNSLWVSIIQSFDSMLIWKNGDKCWFDKMCNIEKSQLNRATWNAEMAQRPQKCEWRRKEKRGIRENRPVTIHPYALFLRHCSKTHGKLCVRQCFMVVLLLVKIPTSNRICTYMMTRCRFTLLVMPILCKCDNGFSYWACAWSHTHRLAPSQADALPCFVTLLQSCLE